jgi:phytoene desaturase
MPEAIVIGAGFAGLSASCFLARAGWNVTLLEKNNQPGGRAQQWQSKGFSFDMGPSWYWMPDVFERFFQQFGKSVNDYYSLTRLDPSYHILWQDGIMPVPAGAESLAQLFESIEPGSAQALKKFLSEAQFKYKIGMEKLVYKPGLSITEYIDKDLLAGLFRLDVFTPMRNHVHAHFRDPKLRLLMEFPVIFLGAMADKIPALYSLMNYADIVGGTWYPQGGIYSVVKAMHSLALELGVRFHFGEEVTGLEIHPAAKNTISVVHTSKNRYKADAVIGAADYHHIETQLLPKQYQTYSSDYWNSRVMAPGCLLFYLGLNKKIPGIGHHTLFFDTDFEAHAKAIYENPSWPEDPLFYMCCPSVTDPTVAPPGSENLFLLVPLAAGLEENDPHMRERYLQKLVDRIEKYTGIKIRDSIILQRSFAHREFISEYHSFKGNAYGLANTLKQTAILKPSCKSKKLRNLYYAGQLTVPGPGVPPSLISGELAARELIRNF